MGTPRLSAALLATVFLLVRPLSAQDAVIRIEPGPATMHEKERAITRVPSLGLEHAFILVDETIRDESSTLAVTVSHHLRAKILSNEGRSLANIELPFATNSWHLEEWWGRTILPDGTVRELEKKDLKRQETLEIFGYKTHVLKGALPGVAPGCIIDYGYVFKGNKRETWVTIPLRRRWPVLDYRYQWLPALWLPSQYHVNRSDEVDLAVQRQSGGVLIAGRMLPPFKEEPWMPPRVLAGPSLWMFYNVGRPSPDPDLFWRAVVARKEAELAQFIGKPKPLQKALRKMDLTESGTPEEKVRQVYDWLGSNIENRLLSTSEEDAAIASEPRLSPESAVDVLSAGAGWPSGIRYLFIGLARSLGLEVDLVLAADRRYHVWDEAILAEGQLREEIVAIHEPGEPLDKARLVDPGSGLPYGGVRWWLTPSRGLAITTEGGVPIPLLPAEVRQNVMETHVTIDFPEAESGTAKVTWSAKGSGQQGYNRRRMLRWIEPPDRAEALEDLCGAGRDFEVRRALAPGLLESESPYQLECQGRIVNILIDEFMEDFQLPIQGAWFPEPPWLAAAERQHPVVFDFPRIDVSKMEVAAPPGFVPEKAPQEVKLETPFGHYGLKFALTENGYQVERAFALLRVVVEVEDYAALRDFLSQVRLADLTQLYFVRAGS